MPAQVKDVTSSVIFFYFTEDEYALKQAVEFILGYLAQAEQNILINWHGRRSSFHIKSSACPLVFSKGV